MIPASCVHNFYAVRIQIFRYAYTVYNVGGIPGLAHCKATGKISGIVLQISGDKANFAPEYGFS